MEREEIQKRLKKELDKNRYEHTLGVMYTAGSLAMAYGYDYEKAMIAGLLHDIMKEDLPDRQRQMTVDSGMSPDPAEIDTPALWHAVAGAAYVRDRLGIDDEEILAGIRFHTIGCAKMTKLEKIVYHGDMISAERSYKDVDKFRKICRDDLDKAMSVALYTISGTSARSADTYRDTRLKHTIII